MKLQPARGTQDLLPDTAKVFRAIDDFAFQKAQTYGFEPISTPIFEFSEVFHRTLGESSDVVSKETYTFTDRGGESLTLRPEGTAGVARAFISNGLAQNLPLRLYYSGPMFRYERPQKGRYRQFHQIGVEVLGLETPETDIECIALAHDLLIGLGLADKIQLEINTLGDSESRSKHREKLVEYLKKYQADLSPDSQIRLEKNPLRILDSKDKKDQEILVGAPALHEFLSPESQMFFEKVLQGLETLKIPYLHQKNLVRGLDYYVHSVFEFTTTHLGAQATVLGGGRYDGLIEIMGGQKTPGVGWACGLERLALLTEPNFGQRPSLQVAVISAEEASEAECLKISHELRNHNIRSETLFGGNVGKKLKRANKIGAHFALILGSSELDQRAVTLKNLGTGEQKTVPRDELLSHLKI
ncbi:MAG: histidine--tRNA ligase [Pseudobdellovibrionaceae bacterium]|jgi:histidyl-tRNA synthetase